MEVGAGRGSRSIVRGLGVLPKKEWPGAVACLAILVCYALTLLPGMHYFGDVTKAQFLGRFLGMTHPTGYPTYILMTSTASWLPFGSLAWKVNFFSALCGAIASGFVYGLSRLLGAAPLLSALGALIFAFGRLAWDQSVVAEVYALNAAFVAATLFALAWWLKSGKSKHFLYAVGVYALSFGNHLTMVTLLPAFLGALILGQWRTIFNKRTVSLALGLIALGAAQYSYLFLASASDSLYLEYRVSTWDEFVNFVSGDHYRGRMLAFDLAEVIQIRAPLLTKTVLRDLGSIALLIPLGMIWTLRGPARSPVFKIGVVLCLALFGEALWFLTYNIPDIAIYSIPVTLIGSVLVVALLHAVAESWAPYSRVGCIALATFAAGSSLANHAPDHTRSARFEAMVDLSIDAAGEDSVIVGRIGYDERMGWVYRLFVDGLAEERNLFVDHNATPKRVLKYLRGEGPLRDFYRKKPIAPGKRVFLTSRGYRGQSWGNQLSTSTVVGPLREVTLREAPGKRRRKQR